MSDGSTPESTEHIVKVRVPGDISERIVVKGLGDDRITRVLASGASQARSILGADAIDRVRDSLNAASLNAASLYARMTPDIPQTISERALAYAKAMDPLAGYRTTSERMLETMNSAHNVRARFAELTNSATLNMSAVYADMMNKAKLGMVSTEAKLGLGPTHAGLVAEMVGSNSYLRAIEAVQQVERTREQILGAAMMTSGAALIEAQLARLREIQNLPRDIIAMFAPTSRDLLAGLTGSSFDSRTVRRLQSAEDEWARFLKKLETDHGIDRKALRFLLPSPLPALNSVSRLNDARNRIRILTELSKTGPSKDDPRGRHAAKVTEWLKAARREESAAMRAAEAAHLLPGTKGRKFSPPKWTDTWATTVKKDRRWANPTAWPWLGDRAHDLASYLSEFVLAKRSRGRRGADGLRGRKMTNEVAELTADILNRWYRRELFYGLNLTAAQVKAAVSYREGTGRKPARYRGNSRRGR